MQVAVSSAFSQKRAGPFSIAAHELRELGLAPLPVGGEDGKQPLVGSFTRWRRIPGSRTLDDWISKWPDANVGIVTKLSGVTIVDIDEPSLLDETVERFGATPLRTSTPSGGIHLWYRGNGERCVNRLDGRKVDIKGDGGIVVVPPSVRNVGPFSGVAYRIIQGSWRDLHSLPKINQDALRTKESTKFSVYANGERNDALFRHLLRNAHFCDDIEVLNCLTSAPLGQIEGIA